MIIGAILGGYLLSVFPASVFEYLLGGAIILISFWFLMEGFEPDSYKGESHDIGTVDGFVGMFSGFCGGFTGMGGPPLIVYLGSKFDKELFRAIIVPIFLLAAIARYTTYGYFGMRNTSNLWLYVFPPAGVIIGNYIRDRFFEQVKQKWFTIIIGRILLFSGIRLILS